MYYILGKFSKILFDILKRVVAFLLVAVVAVPLVLAACDKDGNTDSTQGSSAIEVQNFIFPDGFVLGSVNVSGMSYDDALKAVEEGAVASVKAFTLKIKADDKEFEYKNTDFEWDFQAEEAVNEAVKYAQSDDFKPSTETGVANNTAYSADVSLQKRLTLRLLIQLFLLMAMTL